MGQYVYEQLIPVTLDTWHSGGLSFTVDSNVFDRKIGILKSDVLVNLKANNSEERITAKMINVPVVCVPINERLYFSYEGALSVIYHSDPSSAYLRIEYYRDSEEFDGYNNY